MSDMIILDDLCQFRAECFFVEILLMIGKAIVVKMSFPDHSAGIYGGFTVRGNRPEYQDASMDHFGVLSFDRQIFSQLLIQHINMGV